MKTKQQPSRMQGGKKSFERIAAQLGILWLTIVLVCIWKPAKRAPLLLRRAILLRTIGSFAQALQNFAKAQKLDATIAGIYGERAIVLGLQNNLTGAEKDYAEAIRLDPDNGIWWRDRGILRTQKGDSAAGLDDLNTALKLKEDAAAFATRAGIHHSITDNQIQALEDASAAVRLQPEDTAVRRLRAEILAELGKHEAAVEDWLAVVRAEPQTELAIQIQLGDTLRILQRYDEALSCFTGLIAKKPVPSVLYEHRGLVYRDQGDLLRAEADVAHAIRINEDGARFDAHPHDVLAQAPYLVRAHIRELRNDPHGALEDYNKAVRYAPHEPVKLLERARVYVAMREYQKALSDCTDALEKGRWPSGATLLDNPPNPGDDRATHVQLKQWTQEKTLKGEVFSLRARSYLGLGNRDAAYADSMIALQHNAEDVYARVIRARMLCDQNKYAAAARDLRVAYDAGVPDDLRAEVEQIRTSLRQQPITGPLMPLEDLVPS